MKKLTVIYFGLVVLVLAACTNPVGAVAKVEEPKEPPKRPDVAAQKNAMEQIEFLAGKWEGEGWMLSGQGKYQFRQTEHVRYNLDGQILLIDGRGYARESAVGAPPTFSAFAIISYNDREQRFEFRSYAKGYAGNYSAEVLEDGSFQWSAGPARYRIWLTDEGNWFETGERPDGEGNWNQFFEMTLSKMNN